VYRKHHNICFHILKDCNVIISGAIMLHTLSQFTEFCVLMRVPDCGCQQPKHVAVDWCHVYVFVCARLWSYKPKKISKFHFFKFSISFIFSVYLFSFCKHIDIFWHAIYYFWALLIFSVGTSPPRNIHSTGTTKHVPVKTQGLFGR